MLTDTQCRKAKAAEKPQKLFDGRGLYLFVAPSGVKSWRLKYRFGEKEKTLTIGRYPDHSLQEARDACIAAHKQLAAGIDPSMDKRQKKAARNAAAGATFESLALAWHQEQVATWSGRYAKTVLNAVTRDLIPYWGKYPIGEITKPMVIERLKAIEKRAIETAKRAQQHMIEIFDFAIGLGHDFVNPAATRISLKPLQQVKRPAITKLDELKTMLWTVERSRARPVTKLASRFIALTAVRPGVVQTLPWAELDGLDREDPIWIIPAARMKLSQERKQEEAFDHHVPLATQAMEVIASLKVLTGLGPLAFPQSRSTRKPLSDATISRMYRDCGYTGQHVPHGWRSSFSTIMNELAAARDRPEDRAIIDLMLAHRPRGTESIYNRSVYMPRRRAIAQEWADMLLEGLPPASALLVMPSS